MLALLLLLAGAPGAGNDLEKPPLTVPLFDGIERSYKSPSNPLKRPEIPDFRRLFELTVACWPEKSWFRGELHVEGRLANKKAAQNSAVEPAFRHDYHPRRPLYRPGGANTLISASELDKERNREAERRGKIAEAVGSLVAARAERVMQTRQLTLLQALEKRAQGRVRMGVAETGEQVRYLEQVAALETRIQALQGDEIKARLHLLSMCDDTNMVRIDAYLDPTNHLKPARRS